MAAPIARVRLARGRLVSFGETAPFRKSSPATPRGEAFGPYLVYEQLGEGGMAYVHRAEMLGEGGFKKTVALKRMRTEWTDDPEFIEAFVHEAQLASRLTHPNIAQAYDLGKIDGTYYIAMELVLGPTLSQIMAQARRAAGPVPLPIALEILIQLCDALDHAHELRDAGGQPLDLIHRDISPSNVIVSREGIAKLIDFGIAKARSARRSTQTGIIKGKHAYVAPEYTYGQLDRRADIWGLGVIAHELLAGRRLFVGETDAATIRNVRNQPIPAPSKFTPGISQDLDDIVLTALQRDPAQRFQNAGAMRVALTTEVRRLRMAVSCAQIRDWVEWAFQQVPRSEHTLHDVIDTLEPSISVCSGDLEPVTPRPALPLPAIAPDAPTVDVMLPKPRAASPAASAAADDEEPTIDAKPVLARLASPRAASPRPALPSLAPARPATRADLDEEEEPTRDAKPVLARLAPRPNTPRPATPRPALPGLAPARPATRADLDEEEEPTRDAKLVLARLAPRPNTPRPATPGLGPATPADLDAEAEPTVDAKPVLARVAMSRPTTPRPATPGPALPGLVPSRSATPVTTGEEPTVDAKPAHRTSVAAAPARRRTTPVDGHRALPAVAETAPARRRTTPADGHRALPVVAEAAPVRHRSARPVPRAPRWNPPTRWTKPPRRRSASPFVLLALIAFAALAVANGWIDLDAWRALLA